MRLLIIAVFLGACSNGKDYSQATCALVDTSGTYADQRGEVIRIIKTTLLPPMLPGDSLILAQIDGDSFSHDNLLAIRTLDYRPSRANRQKSELALELDNLGKLRSSRYTDISGGLMLCREYLEETGAGDRVVLMFSDMKEELPRGVHRELASDELQDTRIIAMNVKKLGADNRNPNVYRHRLAAWQRRVSESGARNWQVIQDPARLAEIIAQR